MQRSWVWCWGGVVAKCRLSDRSQMFGNYTLKNGHLGFGHDQVSGMGGHVVYERQ